MPSSAMLRRLGLQRVLMPLMEGDKSAATGGRGDSPAFIGEEVHRRQRALLCVDTMKRLLPTAASSMLPSPAAVMKPLLRGKELLKCPSSHLSQGAQLQNPVAGFTRSSMASQMKAMFPYRVMVTQRGYSSNKGNEDAKIKWKKTLKKYKKRFRRGLDKCLWSMGYRPTARFRAFLGLLAFGLTSQSAGEVRSCIVAAAQATANVTEALEPEELSVNRFLEVAEKGVVDDGAGWEY